ncbi:alpha/beta hydrolase [Bradyrhizobium sp. INPA01-394B]|uniref:Alpha/beta hydrolase n=1 Tax=Bradyrhizobium campsiandrae TaxID=1729892 RepID=A0ABR7U8L2_9BRAD|nr:alpha/beta hydrolase [Bradyrhizobium campsiandrae]MBC9980320.1 alpha/beta hydrolase [Bradyrhizobium campsiandrae]
MPVVQVGDARVAYQIEGSGPGLVLVHGTGGNSQTNWSQMVGRLAESRTVVRPDYSGSGATIDKGGPLTVALLAAQVVAAVKDAAAAPFDLVGFSLGAAVATYIAAEYPDLVRSVVLLAGFASSADARQTMQFELWRDLVRTDHRAMARFILITGFSPDFLSSLDDAAISAAVDEIVTNTNWEGMARQIELDLTIDVRDRAPRIAKPALVIGCIHDHMVPPAHARELAALIPGSRYVDMATGHLAPLEQPDKFADLVLDFLRGDLA